MRPTFCLSISTMARIQDRRLSRAKRTAGWLGKECSSALKRYWGYPRRNSSITYSWICNRVVRRPNCNRRARNIRPIRIPRRTPNGVGSAPTQAM
eukprot:5838370-Pyramimonas_sp.AAC.1